MEKLKEFEAFFENPNEASYAAYSIKDGFGVRPFKDGVVDPWREGICDRLISGQLELLLEDDKAMFFLETNKIAGSNIRNLHWTSNYAVGILYKKVGDDGSNLGCSVRITSNRSNSSRFLSEVLYFDLPGEFDCERLERDALLLKLLKASEEIDEGLKQKSHLEECRNKIDSLANELREDCHKRMEILGEGLESGAKPKRSLKEELAYLKEIDAWQAAVNEIASARLRLMASNKKLSSLNTSNLSEEEFEMLPRVFPSITCTSFGFLLDSSLVKKRLWLRDSINNCV